MKEKAKYFDTRIKGINRELAVMTNQEEKGRMQELQATFIQKYEEVSFERRRILLYKVKSTDSPWSDAFLDLIVTFDWVWSWRPVNSCYLNFNFDFVSNKNSVFHHRVFYLRYILSQILVVVLNVSIVR